MSRAEIAKEQFRALLARHQLDMTAMAKKLREKEFDPGFAYRLFKGEVKTEPEAESLRKIAAAVGETKEEAFPESGETPPPLPPKLAKLNSILRKLEGLPEEAVDLVAKYTAYIVAEYENAPKTLEPDTKEKPRPTKTPRQKRRTQ